MDTLFDNPAVAELLGSGTTSMLATIFKQMEIAEEEIAAAREGNTEADRDDPLWDAFKLLRATDDLMRTEFVYRAHCREILQRIRDGVDTRPATDAELSCGISSASMSAPLGSDAVCLQLRIFKRAFPEQYEQLGYEVETHESLFRGEADELERTLRRRGRQDWRKPEKKAREETA